MTGGLETLLSSAVNVLVLLVEELEIVRELSNLTQCEHLFSKAT